MVLGAGQTIFLTMWLKRSFKPTFAGLFLLSDCSQSQTSALLFSKHNLEQAQQCMTWQCHFGMRDSMSKDVNGHYSVVSGLTKICWWHLYIQGKTGPASHMGPIYWYDTNGGYLFKKGSLPKLAWTLVFQFFYWKTIIGLIRINDKGERRQGEKEIIPALLIVTRVGSHDYKLSTAAQVLWLFLRPLD